MFPKTILQRFCTLSIRNKITITGICIAVIGGLDTFFVDDSDTDFVNSVTDSTINNQNIINNSTIIFPVTENSTEVKKETYSVEDVISSVYLDSVDHHLSSSYRVMARSMGGFDFRDNGENHIFFSGITPFKLQKVDAIFGPDYRLYGKAYNLNERNKTVDVDIYFISMVDNYGNAFEVRSKTNQPIGYAESLNKITQKVVSIEKSDRGYYFSSGNDVQIFLEYTKDDIELVGKTR
ncbi:hypothetical protein AB835_09620 [Candidatus Endobugula sertula]|uniref:Uncharacterized protein n=1 Tax=Candidatus Endobugula sertula TaxID=62101 RepID=A0A1D2QNW0_9GAMM|nr:hypothetical protein AB835_09620 [Candidatus Endobugula sertula]